MSALANEWVTPKDQADKEDPKQYKIKPLKPLELTELLTDGCNKENGIKLNFKGIVLALKYGLADSIDLNQIRSSHHAEVAFAVLQKGLLAEEERKNS